MTSIVALLMFAAAFGGIIKKLGVIDCLLSRIFGNSVNAFRIITSSRHSTRHLFCGHRKLFCHQFRFWLLPSMKFMTGKSCRGENISAILLDTGTGLSPLVPWSATAIFVSGTLGYASVDYCLFAPVIWFAVLLYPVVGLIVWKKQRCPAVSAGSAKKKAGKAFVIKKILCHREKACIIQERRLFRYSHRWEKRKRLPRLPAQVP